MLTFDNREILVEGILSETNLHSNYNYILNQKREEIN